MKTREAWIGFFGAVAGVLLTVVGQPLVEQRLRGLEEGIFSVDISSISGEDLDPEFRSQISRYPIFIKISHVEGPSVKSITVTLKSKHSLSDLKPERQDDAAKFAFSSDGRTLVITIPELRKNAANQYRLSSAGSPDYSSSTQMSSGRIFVAESTSDEMWYLSTTFKSIILIVIMLFSALSFFYLASLALNENLRGVFKDRRFWLVYVVAIMVAILPVIGDIAIVIPLGVASLLAGRITRLEQCIQEQSERKA